MSYIRESFLKLLVLLDLMTGDAERTNDRRQTCRKLGSGVLGTQMETHSSLIAFLTSLYSASFLYL
jgi:hypothetical protein